jgi:hypothetical protein
LVQINDALIGNVNFQGLWNAATNTPTLANPPASGTKGYYYIVSTAGTFAGISFEVGDWIISDGTAWGKVDNTDAVSSVFGRTGNVVASNGDYTTAQVTESGNLYYTDGRARGALSFAAGSGAYNSSTGVITIPTNNNQITNGAGYITSAALGGYVQGSGSAGQVAYWSSGSAITGESNLFWDATNDRLGIGVPAPVYPLHLKRASNINIGFGQQNSGISIEAVNDLVNANIPMSYYASAHYFMNGNVGIGTVSTGAKLNILVPNSGSNVAGLDITNGANASFNVSLRTDVTEIIAGGTGNMVFSNSGGPRLTLASTGAATFSSSVNLGTNANGADTALLNIKQAGASYNQGIYIERGGERNGYHMYIGGALDSLTFRRNYFGAQSDVMSLTRDGNVGIGTASPAYLLDLWSTSATLRIRNITAPATGGTSSLLFEGINNFSGVSQSFINSIQAGNSGATQLVFGTSGTLDATATERMRITSGGNVGIGTNSPASRLQIEGTGTGAWLTINRTDSGTNVIDYTQSGTRLGYIGYIVNDLFINNSTASSTVFFTSGAERMRITSGGNVLIGTTTDFGQKVCISSGNTSESTAHLNLVNSGIYSGFHFLNDTGYYIGQNSGFRSLRLYSGTNINNGMTLAPSGAVTFNNLAGSGNRIVVANSGGTLISAVIGSGLAFDGTTLTATGGSSGSISGSGTSGTVALFTGTSSIGNSLITQSGIRIGINTASPRTAASGTNSTLDVKGGIYFGSSGVESTCINNDDSFVLNFDSNNNGGTNNFFKIAKGTTGETGGTELFRVSGNGNVLIGTTTDNGPRLQVAPSPSSWISGTFAGTGGSNKVVIGNFSGVASIGAHSNALDAWANLAINFGAGNVLIGTLTDNGNRLRVAGTIFSDSSVTATSFFESSDATIKTLVEDDYQAKGIDSVVAKLYIKNGKQELGYYAQDLEGVLPSAVSKGSNGLLNLSYREVHTAKIAYLEQRIKQLENELLKPS